MGSCPSQSISPKVNIIAWLEFKLAYYDVTVQHINHYTTENPLHHPLFQPTVSKERKKINKYDLLPRTSRLPINKASRISWEWKCRIIDRTQELCGFPEMLPPCFPLARFGWGEESWLMFSIYTIEESTPLPTTRSSSLKTEKHLSGSPLTKLTNKIFKFMTREQYRSEIK